MVARSASRMTAGDPALARLTAAQSAGRSLVLLFGDGTLAPPGPAALPAPARELLRHLAALPRVFVGVVGGRRLDELRSAVGLGGLYYVGSGGLELDLLGVRLGHPCEAEGRELVARVAPRVREAASAYPGAWVEDRPVGLALHYRSLLPLQAACLLADVRDRLAAERPCLRLTHGDAALEVAPDLGWTKGTAVRRIVEDAARTALPFYAGSSPEDAEAFAAAEELGGLAAAVGPQAPPAAVRLAGPAAMVRMMERLLDALTPPPTRRGGVSVN